jgi:serine phosphatase RsbU (regulator of sigma subunit)
MAAVTRSVIRSLSAYYRQPATLLEMVAKQMYEDLDRLEIFVTVAVGIIDVPAGEIRIANAGHCPVVLADSARTLEIGPENPPVGIEAAPSYPQCVIPISPNTKILAYTDGLVDPRNARPSFHHEDDVAAWFSTAAPKSSILTELKTALLERLEYAADAAFLADDQTFLMLSCNDLPPSTSWPNS